MFGTTLLAFYTFILLYLGWRISTVPFIAHRVPRWCLVLAGLFLWIIFYLGRYFGHGGEGILAAALEYTGMNCLGVIFLAFVFVLPVDLITAFGFLFPERASRLRGLALAAAVLLAAFALIQGHRAPAVARFEVPLRNLPEELDGTVLVAVSDTHIDKILGSRWLSARVRQVNGLSPDIVAFVGDIFEGHGGPPEGALKILSELTAPFGLWSVSGNHEGYGNRQGNGEILKQAGFISLDGTWKEIRPGLVLAGVSDLTSHMRRKKGGDPVGFALAGHPEGSTVLLSHSPLQTVRAAEAGVDLMISGHTHGGQVWPFGILVRKRYPLLEGRYQVDGMAVIVTRGAGTWGPRMRLFKRGEILHLTLRSPAGSEK